MSAPVRIAEVPRHPTAVITLHWVTLAALIAGVLLILARDGVDGRVLRGWLLDIHRQTGLLIFCLLLARLTVRLALRGMPAIDSPSPIARAAATATHAALYLLLICVPLLGLVLSNAHGHTVHFLGIALPTLVEADGDLADALADWHARAAWFLVALGLAHAIAALWHHFIRRDGVLVAMLPPWRRTTRTDETSA